MATSNFNKLAKASEKKRDILTKKLKREINSLYQGLYRDMQKKASKIPSNASESYWKALQKELGKEIVRINKEILTITKKSIKESAELGANVQGDFFAMLSNDYKLGIDDAIWKMCTTIHTDTVAEILAGKIYKDRAGLSERIWADTKRFEKDIDVIISEGLSQKKGTYEIAKDLEKYVNPREKQTVYNGVRGQCNYNTYRLAHTSVIHSYQQAAKRSANKNPYVTHIRWISALSHTRPKTCEICRERHNRLYKPEDMPLDHPMGVCTFLYEIPMSLEDIGTELSNWRKGEPNEKLDNWFKDNGKDFIPNGKDNNKKDNANNRGRSERTSNAGNSYLNKNGKEIEIRLDGMRETSVKRVKETIYELCSKYNTNLNTVNKGAKGAAGMVDLGFNMHLSSTKVDNIVHEFAHSMAISKADKLGITNDKEFWKDIEKVRKQYEKACKDDSSKSVSSYSHQDKDEFMAELFMHSYLKNTEHLSPWVGKDFEFSDKVMSIINKYFAK